METKEYRVTRGGLFHTQKVHYSKETQELIHRLLEESKLSILQRQELKASVKRGDPLPSPVRTGMSQSLSDVRLRRSEVLVPSALPRRRSYQAIVSSGAYDRERFDPPYNFRIKDRDVEKQKLQSLMTFGKEVPQDLSNFKHSRVKELKEDNQEALFDHMVQEIKERLTFLQEMEELGEAKAYQTVIEQEIAAKMRQMIKIDKEKFLQLNLNLGNTDKSNTDNDKFIKNNKNVSTNYLKNNSAK